MGKRKIKLKPKSELGMNRELPMCYNCMFWHRDNNGYCPWYKNNYDYNHRCASRKFFRYNFDLPYENKYF